MFDALGPLLLVVIWIIRQVYSAIQEQKAAEAAKEAAAERLEREAAFAEEGDPAQAGAPQPAQAKAAPDDVRSEVEEFLKRIGQARDEPAAKPEQPAEPPRRRRPLDPFEEPPRRQQQRPSPPRRQRQPAQPEIELLVDVNEPAQPKKPATPNPPRQSRKPRERTELRHLPESQLAEQSATMGQGIAKADDRIEARLHEKFDHRLGKLSTDKAGVADDKPAPEPISGVAKIRAMLSAPGGIRDAVILSEILRRPGDQL